MRRANVGSVLGWLVVAACDTGGGEWAGTVDTLPSGVIEVRNPATGLWTDPVPWRLIEDLRIGSVEGGGPTTFGLVNAIAVDGWGRIFVLDRQAQEIRVFEADGAYVRTIGRPGGGPGEFRQAYGMFVDSLERLWVVDSRNPQYSVFDSSGTYLSGYRREVTRYGFMWEGALLSSGDLWDLTGVPVGDSRRGALVRFDSTVGWSDTLVLHEPDLEIPVYDFRDARGIGMMLGVPFAPAYYWVLDPRGFVWAGVSTTYRLARVRLDGDTVMYVGRAHSPVPVTDAERDSALAPIRDQAGDRFVDPGFIPDNKPAFDKLVPDEDGFLWVVRALPHGEAGSALDVFDPEGRFLGTVQSPVTISRYAPTVVRRNAIYAMVRDELEVPYVVRLRIDGR